jgi:hypothetical protein
VSAATLSKLSPQHSNPPCTALNCTQLNKPFYKSWSRHSLTILFEFAVLLGPPLIILRREKVVCLVNVSS